MKRLIVSTLMLWTVMACNNTPKEIPVADDALANTEMAEAQRDKSKDTNPFDLYF